ncbi:zinc finger protein 888-like [Oppia nitens]|uniref:zinc finger protein 888-like n=1 Tax=Oppia nitens TaxID=1686743 RepID=UPI0023DA372B|nr:zinc finger protein 888-like [Oppia nitens]
MMTKWVIIAVVDNHNNSHTLKPDETSSVANKYWFNIPSIVKTIANLKTLLTTVNEDLIGDDFDISLNDCLLSDDTDICIIKVEDILEIRRKCVDHLTNHLTAQSSSSNGHQNNDNKKWINIFSHISGQLDQYWYAISSRVRTVRQLKQELVAIEDLQIDEMDLLMKDALLVDNTNIDIINTIDNVIEIKRKSMSDDYSLSTTMETMSNTNNWLTDNNNDNKDSKSMVTTMTTTTKSDTSEITDDTSHGFTSSVDSAYSTDHTNIITVNNMTIGGDETAAPVANKSTNDILSHTKLSKSTSKAICDYNNCGIEFQTQHSCWQHKYAVHYLRQGGTHNTINKYIGPDIPDIKSIDADILDIKSIGADNSDNKHIECDYRNCDKTFETLLDFTQHRIAVHLGDCDKYSVTDTTGALNITANNKRISCNHKNCGKTFRSIADFRQHYRAVHSYRCDFSECHYDCDNYYELLIHEKSDHNMHTTECPNSYLKCRKCHKKYQRVANLMKHMQDHHKLFRCPYEMCESRIYTEFKLKLHMFKVHTHNCANRPFYLKCHRIGCEKEFKAYVDLQQHVLDAHPLIKCHYIGCDKTFQSKLNLNVHIYVAHFKQ